MEKKNLKGNDVLKELGVQLERCDTQRKEDGPLTSTTVGSLEEVGGISASDSGSEMSLELEKSVASNASFASMGSGEAQRVRKKRTRASDADAEADDHPESSAFKRRGTPVPKRGRGRPPNSGQYLGLAKGKRELMEARRAEMELQAEKEVPELIQRRRLDRALRPAGFDDVVDSRLSSNLLERVDDGIKVITKVATKSKNLKGTFVKALKEAAEMIREAVNALQSISSTDETHRLQADNKRLRDEVATLQKEVASMRLSIEKAARPAQERTPAPTLQAEHIARDVLSQVGTMISARFEALEERLLPEKRLRPPLAADRRSAEPGPSSAPDPTPTFLGETWSAVVRKGKGKGKKTAPALDVQMSASISTKPKKSVAKPVATPKPSAAAVKSISVPRPPLVATGSAAVPKSVMLPEGSLHWDKNSANIQVMSEDTAWK
ncbi:unnamed protein product, partial [Iphiclides podalirius]